MRHKQRIAISRLISDIIKSDEVICREEIAAYNKIIRVFDISTEELFEAQQLTLEDAVKYLKHMPSEEQQRLYKNLTLAASAGYGCVAQEALLLFTLSACLNDTTDKYMLLTTETKGYRTDDKYVIYLESDYMPAINEEIQEHYDTIANLLRDCGYKVHLAKDDVNAGDFFFALTTDLSKGLKKEGYLMTIEDAIYVEAEESTDVEYTTMVKEVIDKYF